MPISIAIIGGGFSGLACAFYLTQYHNVQVTLYEKKIIGAEASGLAAGLIHPFTGAHAKLNRFGLEGFHETVKLLNESSQFLKNSVAKFTKILRIATTQEQIQDYQLTANNYPTLTKWIDSTELKNSFPYLKGFGALEIANGWQVEPKLYMEGLWKICESRGAVIKYQKIDHVDELKNYHATIIAAGNGSDFLATNLKVAKNKGQILTCEATRDFLLPIPLNSKAYLLKDEFRNQIIAGATFEKKFQNEKPDLDFAKKEIIPKIKAFFPKFNENASFLAKAAIRVSSPDHLPIAKLIDDKVWCLTAMGSKGLLYHAFYAKKLVQQIMQQNLID